MILKKLKTNGIKCDVGICQSTALFAISGEGVAVENQINICPKCLRALRELLEKECQSFQLERRDCIKSKDESALKNTAKKS